jgi:hypothetical protein
MNEFITISTYILLGLSVSVLILGWGVVASFTEKFRRTRWIMKNQFTQELWQTQHRFSPRELKRMMSQRNWNSKAVARVEEE